MLVRRLVINGYGRTVRRGVGEFHGGFVIESIWAAWETLHNDAVVLPIKLQIVDDATGELHFASSIKSVDGEPVMVVDWPQPVPESAVEEDSHVSR